MTKGSMTRGQNETFSPDSHHVDDASMAQLAEVTRERDRLRTTLEDYRACMKKGMPALVGERDRYRDACRKIARLTTERTCIKCDRARGIARNALARPTGDDAGSPPSHARS